MTVNTRRATLALLMMMLALVTSACMADVANDDEVNVAALTATQIDDDEPLGRKVQACWKDSEPRGRGKFPDKDSHECPENLEKSMGLCYPKCGDKRIGFGPLCVDDCKSTPFTSTAAFFCCESDELCADLMKEAATKLPKTLVKLGLDLLRNPNDIRKITQDLRNMIAEAMELRLPLCSKIPPTGEENELKTADAIDDITAVA